MRYNGHVEISVGTDKNVLCTEEQKLLSCKICELPLRIDGTRLQRLIVKLYNDLETAGVFLKPKTYLSDERGCPNKVPVIGIPFYIVDSRLCCLKGQLTGTDAEDDLEVLMFLRHEAGHTFNYAHRLYNNLKWRKLFGRFSLPYKNDYPVLPFSTRYVRHLPVWYAQKHPDDDFAETFAIWLTPGFDWRKEYAGTPAMDKLLYVDELADKYRDKPPKVSGGRLDMPIEDIKITLGEYFRTH